MHVVLHRRLVPVHRPRIVLLGTVPEQSVVGTVLKEVVYGERCFVETRVKEDSVAVGKDHERLQGVGHCVVEEEQDLRLWLLLKRIVVGIRRSVGELDRQSQADRRQAQCNDDEEAEGKSLEDGPLGLICRILDEELSIAVLVLVEEAQVAAVCSPCLPHVGPRRPEVQTTNIVQNVDDFRSRISAEELNLNA